MGRKQGDSKRPPPAFFELKKEARFFDALAVLSMSRAV